MILGIGCNLDAAGVYVFTCSFCLSCFEVILSHVMGFF